MAEQTVEEEKEEQALVANKSALDKEFNKIRELLKQRENELLDQIDASYGKSIHLQFDTDNLAKVWSV